MAYSDTDLANQALGLLGVNPITAIDEDSDVAETIRSQLASVKDATLADGEWPCAVVWRSLASTTVPTNCPWSYAFTLPTDPFCLLPLDINADAQNPDSTGDYFTYSGRTLLANVSSVTLRYVSRIVDGSQYEAGLWNALAARLAATISPVVAPAMVGTAWQIYKDAKKAASQESKRSAGPTSLTNTDYEALR